MSAIKLLVTVVCSLSVPAAVAATIGKNAIVGKNAADLMHKAEGQTRGRSLESRLMMRVVHGSSIRTIEFLLWAKGTEKAAVKVLSPVKDRGIARLRLGTELWSYSPDVERIQKVAPSMMKQSWMGADFTNGDLVRSTNLSRYYGHRIAGEEKRDGLDVYRIESVPRGGTPVEGGKVVTWLTKRDSVVVRQEYYDEAGKLERTLECKNFKTSGSHRYASTLVVTKPGDSGGFTQIDYRSMRFDRPIDESVFTQEFLRKRIEDSELPK